jgi:hypothetical protein
VKIFKTRYFLDIAFHKPERIDLYPARQGEISKKSEVKCQLVKNVVLSHTDVHKLSEVEVQMFDNLWSF